MSRRVLVSQLALLMLVLGFAASDAQEAKTKTPAIRYGLTLKYRKAGQDEFEKGQKYAVECWQEQETENAIYISQTGALSAVSKGLFKGGDGKDKGPLSQHGLEILVRRADSKEKNPKFGVECFLDENNTNLIYVADTGSISVVPSKFASPTKGKPKGYDRLHGMDLRVRKAGDKDWDKATTKTYGIDVFEDNNNGSVVYLSETGSVAVVTPKLADKSSGAKTKPVWQYGLDLKVRGATEKEVGKDTKAWGVEVFKDGANGCMVYIVENGNIAVVPTKLAKSIDGKSKDPKLERGLALGVRKLDENEFTEKTKRFGVEVYLDENNGNIVYISETGGIAVVPPKDE